MATLKILTIDNVDKNKSRRDSYSDDDDLEQEVCQKLIRLSFAKIVSSKNTRGGAKLHRNLLILHLLQKARTNHRRSSSESPPPVTQEDRSSMTTSASEPAKFDEVDMDEQEENAEVDNESNSSPSTALPPMSHILTQAAEEITAEDDDDDDQGLSFAPLQLVFATDAVTDRQLVGDDEPAAAVVVPELYDMDVGVQEEQGENAPNGRLLSGARTTPSGTVSDDNDQSSSSSSSSSDEDSNSVEKDELHRRKHRKRKPSVNQWTASKKCCTELGSGQLNGLISVFSHGLTVKKSVQASSAGADQLVPSVAASTGTSLVSRSLSCPSLVRLACNPLICK